MARKLLALVVLILAAAAAHAAPDVEPVLTYVHKSDLFRGFPVNHRSEWQTDYAGAGVTITIGARRRYELDLTHGVKSWDSKGKLESGTHIALRYYPKRK